MSRILRIDGRPWGYDIHYDKMVVAVDRLFNVVKVCPVERVE